MSPTVSPRPKRPDMVICPHCGTPNDPLRGSPNCRNCSRPLSGSAQPGEVAPRADVVAVPFLDGHIPCVMHEGEPKVILKPIAEGVMGLSWPRQYAKLSADQTACVAFMAMQVPGDDQVRKHTIVSLETFAVWLASLQPSRVAKHARETVIAYKREAGRALREHFFGQPQRELSRKELARYWYEAEERAELLAEENAALTAEVDAMTPVVEEHEQIVATRGLIPMSVFAQQSGIIRPNGRPLGEQSANAVLRALRILKDSPGTEQHNTPYQEHAHRIVTKVERRGPVTANVPYVVPKHVGYLAGRIDAYFYPGRARMPRPRLGQLRAIGGGA